MRLTQLRLRAARRGLLHRRSWWPLPTPAATGASLTDLNLCQVVQRLQTGWAIQKQGTGAGPEKGRQAYRYRDESFLGLFVSPFQAGESIIYFFF